MSSASEEKVPVGDPCHASPMPFNPLIVGVGGTSRANSTSEKAVIAALRAAEKMGARTKLFDGQFIASLPLYVPDRVERTRSECDFVDAVRSCHGIIVSTPGYHGSLSGPVKNILDVLEDTARDAIPYLHGRAFGCVVTAFGWQACGTTLVSLRMIAHALRAWPTPFGATLNTSTTPFSEDGECLGETTSKQLFEVAFQVVEFARSREALRKSDSICST